MDMGSNDLVEKINIFTQKIGFCGGGGLRSPISEGSVWVIDPIGGTNNFVTQKEDFAVMVAYFERQNRSVWPDPDVMRDYLLRGWRIPSYLCEVELT